MFKSQSLPNESRCPIAHGISPAPQSPNGCPIGKMAASFDPFEAAYHEDPPEYVRWARDQEPVFFSPKLGYWVVTRYEDIKPIFRDSRTFSPSNTLEKITPNSKEANDVLESHGYAMSRTLVNEEEPAHMARRRVLMEPFTPEELMHHEPMVRKIVRQYVDRFINDGKADLVDQMLYEVPLTIALHFLGVPEEDVGMLRKFAVAHTVNTWGRPKPEQQLEVAHAVGNFWQYAGKVLEKMRLDPSGHGWMKYGIRKQAEFPDVITDSYLHSMMMAGIVAAHETTSLATTNAVKLLLQHTNAWREISEDPGLISNAVEECLRFSGPIAGWRRLATKDTKVGGLDIPAGSKFLILMSSANHDERYFSDPDFFDIRRENSSEHLSFGYGSHQCMGKNLARLELQIFLEELSKRLPHMKLANQKFTYIPNVAFRGPEHLWVEWDPKQNPERNNPHLLDAKFAVRLGEPSKHSISRVMTVKSVTVVAQDIVKICLSSVDGKALPRWTPGAHIDVECGDTSLARQYSLCGDPEDTGSLEIAVLRDPSSRGGSAWIHDHVKAGDQLKIRGPRNYFRFNEECKKAIFIAGGIGITPVQVMARWAKLKGIDYEVHYSGRNRISMPFLDELSTLHGERLHVYAKEEGLRNNFKTLLERTDQHAQIYACGPERMLDDLGKCCAERPEDSLHIEHFSSKLGTLDPSKESAFEVELKDSGMVITVPADQTLLQALRGFNIDVQSDCGEGLCGSCEVHVLEGEIDHRDFVLTRAERSANDKILACCSRACGGTKLVLEL